MRKKKLFIPLFLQMKQQIIVKISLKKRTVCKASMLNLSLQIIIIVKTISKFSSIKMMIKIILNLREDDKLRNQSIKEM